MDMQCVGVSVSLFKPWPKGCLSPIGIVLWPVIFTVAIRIPAPPPPPVIFAVAIRIPDPPIICL